MTNQILDALTTASADLSADDIAAWLRDSGDSGDISVTTAEVTRLLSGALAKKVRQDANGKWSLTAQKKSGASRKTTKKKASAPTNRESGTDPPECPKCGKPMVVRTAKKGPRAGQQFYGCSGFPQCKATREITQANGPVNGAASKTPKRKRWADASYSLFPEEEEEDDNQLGDTAREAPPKNSEESCPECGAPMRVRTAKHGPNAGGKFWGCTQYPKCRGTVPIDEHKRGDAENSSDFTVAYERPRQIDAFPSTNSTDATYFECSALPREAIAAIQYVDASASHLRALCQWQLDYPGTVERPFNGDLAWLPVVEKILKRGLATTLSPVLEDKLRVLTRHSDDDHILWEETLQTAAVAPRPSPHWSSGFGSDEERLFFEEVLPSIAGDYIRGWVERQVAWDALTNGAFGKCTDQRVDFLIAHPRGLRLVVEIDGAQHNQKVETDKRRDAPLKAAGYNVARVPAHEIRAGTGEALDQLRKLLSEFQNEYGPEAAQNEFLLLTRRAHQLQMTLWHGLSNGLIKRDESSSIKVSVDLDPGIGKTKTEQFSRMVLADLNELIADVAALYGESSKHVEFQYAAVEEADVAIGFTPDYTATHPKTLLIRDVYLPLTVSTDSLHSVPAVASNIDEAVCLRLLRRIFGFDTFREGQFEAIRRSLSHCDSIVLLPPGAGKSVAFQLSALLRPGVCIVIEPIISLIQDQVDNLRGFGISRACQLTSALSQKSQRAVLDLLAQGEYHFCYVAPERFQNQNFRDSLRALTTHTAVSLVTIDEAHCVSEWGHDFRPAYLNIARISRDYCASNGVAPPLIALTGTASRAVLKDVQRELEISDFEAVITPKTFDRPELHFRIISCDSKEKTHRLKGILESLPALFRRSRASFFKPSGPATDSGLIFCPHVNGDFGVVRVSREAGKILKRAVPYYSGTPPKNVPRQTWEEKKRQTAREFKRNQVALMVCTKAFGMGIDKPNIRYTVHFCLPQSIEAFYQESGRAGRDKRDAQCYVLFSNDWPARTKKILRPSARLKTLHDAIDAAGWDDADDITRILWFHRGNFRGTKIDVQDVTDAVKTIGDMGTPRSVVIPFVEPRDYTRQEKAIYRLLTVGAVADYTINHSACEFHVRLTGFDAEQIADRLYHHIAAYQRGQARVAVERLRKHIGISREKFVLRAAKELIRFVYEVIERSRRQALSEMLKLCEQSKDEADIRQRLLAHLSASGFASVVDKIVDSADGGLSEAVAALEEVGSAIDANQLRGESGRALEAYPDHTGLRLIRGISEAMTEAPNSETVSENVSACINFAQSKYGLTLEDIMTPVIKAVQIAADAKPEIADPIVAGLLDGASDKHAVAKRIVHSLPPEATGHAVAWLINRLRSRLSKILET